MNTNYTNYLICVYLLCICVYLCYGFERRDWIIVSTVL
jgi:hypothetical protein